MKLLFTGIITFLTYITCFGQVDTTKIPMVAYWQKGDSYNFQITKMNQQWKAGNLTKNDSSAYICNFLVIDSSSSGYKIKWSFKTELATYNLPEELMVRLSKYNMTEVIYTTNEVGTFVGIENWKEISTTMKSMFKEMNDYMVVEQKMDAEIWAKIMKPMTEVYESKEGIETLVFMELQYFHFLFGIEYSTQETLVYEEQLPNLLSGEPMRGDAKIYVESVDFDNSFCVFVQEKTINPEDTRSMIKSFFERTGMDQQEMQHSLATAVLEMKDYNRYEFFYDPGIPYKIETNRVFLVDIGKDNYKRMNIIRIELVD